MLPFISTYATVDSISSTVTQSNIREIMFTHEMFT